MCCLWVGQQQQQQQQRQPKQQAELLTLVNRDIGADGLVW
jgi:hypothetical protein